MYWANWVVYLRRTYSSRCRLAVMMMTEMMMSPSGSENFSGIKVCWKTLSDRFVINTVSSTKLKQRNWSKFNKRLVKQENEVKHAVLWSKLIAMLFCFVFMPKIRINSEFR